MIALFAFVAAATTTSVSDGECQQVGTFTGGTLPELSGLTFSRDHDRAYAINDSGNAFQVFVTTPLGAPLQTVAITGNKPPDTEDLSIGPCPRAALGSCLFVADVGDNGVNRGSVKLIIIPETPTFAPSVAPLKTVTLKYSDGRAHNCEAVATHPLTGDVFLMSKVDDDPHMYKVAFKDLLAAAALGSTVTARDIGTIDFDALFDKADELVTGMAISPDGTRFAIITYSDAYEFQFDLSVPLTVYTSQLTRASRTRHILTHLKQQEAIAYDRNGGLFYSTETGSVSTAAALNRITNPPPTCVNP